VNPFTTVLDALDYIRSKLADWANVPRRLEQLIMRAGQVQAAARVQGDAKAAARAADVIVSAGDALHNYTVITGKLEQVKSWLRSVGLLHGQQANMLGVVPVVPVVLVAVVLAVGAGMFLVYKSLAYNEALLRDVEKGLLPVAVLPGGGGTKPPGGFFDNFGKYFGGTTGLVLGLGAVGLLVWSARRHAPAPRTA